jgi:hypothetical protein
MKRHEILMGGNSLNNNASSNQIEGSNSIVKDLKLRLEELIRKSIT